MHTMFNLTVNNAYIKIHTLRRRDETRIIEIGSAC